MTERPDETGSGRRDPTDLVDDLRRLAALRDRDELTEAEYEQERVRLVEEYMRQGDGE